MKAQVLVTGGAGFIGSHIVDRLIAEGYAVRVLDVLDPQVHGPARQWPAYLHPEAELIVGDVRDHQVMAQALQGVDIVSHQAAAVGVGQSMYQIARYMDVNAQGTAVLLELLTSGQYAVQKLVVASSMSIYGEGRYRCSKCGYVAPRLRPIRQLQAREWEMVCPTCGGQTEPAPTDEEKPPYPTSVYAISKRDQEELCLTVGRAYGIPTVALRYFNVYGPRQALSNPYTGIIAIFASRLLNSRPPLVFEDGRQMRDFVHVRDIARAHQLAIESHNADYQAFNVGTGQTTSVLDIAYLLGKVLNREIEPEVVNRFREGDIRHCYADTATAKEILGFEAQVSVSEGLREMVDWLCQQQAVDQIDVAQKELAERGLIV